MDLKETELQTAKSIDNLTNDIINQLKTVWIETFDSDMYEINVKKLSEHVSLFYKEIYLETKTRQDEIKENLKIIRKEIEELCGILKIDNMSNLKRDIPLYKAQIELSEILDKLNDCLEKRKIKIQEYLKEENILCKELGINTKCIPENYLPTETELKNYQTYLDNLKAEKEKRLNEISILRNEVKNLMYELEMSVPKSDEELLNSSSILLTDENIHKLHLLRTQHSVQAYEFQQTIENMKIKLINLWDSLNINQSGRNDLKIYVQYSKATYDNLENEIKHYTEIRKQNIKECIIELRKDIELYWNKSLKNEAERSKFICLKSKCYTEDLLALHELELEDLKKFYEDNKIFFELLEEIKILSGRMKELNEQQSLSTRFNNRGGQLLKQAKEIKYIKNKLPKLKKLLTEEAIKYEQKTNKKFTIYGNNILDVIKSEWEEQNTSIKTTNKIYNKHESCIKPGSQLPIKKFSSTGKLGEHPKMTRQQLFDKLNNEKLIIKPPGKSSFVKNKTK